MTISEVNDGLSWDNYVHAHPNGTFCHLFGWGEAIERAYGHRKFYLAATDNGQIRGVLSLVLIESRLFGRNLVSMPFMDYGGPLADNEEVRKFLVEKAKELARENKATLSLRCAEEQNLGLPAWMDKVTMLMDLGDSEEQFWKRLPSERRNRIRKGQKNGLTASFQGAEAIEQFYKVFATNMRDLGSPVHSRKFFYEMFAHVGDCLRIALVSYQGRPVGAACFPIYKNRLTIPGWISCLREYFHLSTNAVLYWELMRYGIAHGCRVFDFGRCSRNTGTYESKRQWHAQPQPLFYYYSSEKPPAGDQQEKYSRKAEIWRRLPLFVANRIGPPLRGNLPN